MKNEDWWELGWVLLVLGAIIFALTALSGCQWDDQFEREVFLLAKESREVKCFEVTEAKDISGVYCLQYVGPLATPSPLPSPSPSEVMP